MPRGFNPVRIPYLDRIFPNFRIKLADVKDLLCAILHVDNDYSTGQMSVDVDGERLHEV